MRCRLKDTVLLEMSSGVIRWQRFDKDDPETYPPYCQELILLVLKNGKGRFIPKAMFGLGDTWQEVKASRGSTITRSTRFNTEDCDDICWAVINVPDHWKEANKS